jgi:amino acid permease
MKIKLRRLQRILEHLEHSLKIQMHLPMTICSIMQFFGYAFVGTKTTKPNLKQKLEGQKTSN